jgi:hypothetical protein
MKRPIVITTVLLALATLCAPASAKLVPVLRSEAEAMAKRNATLHVARPCKNARQLGQRGKLKERRRLLPGDVLKVRELYERSGPPRLIVSTKDGAEFRVRLECLSKRRPDYSWRGKGSFKAFYAGLLRDLPRLMDLHVKLARKHKFHIPVTDPETKRLHADWQRSKAALNQIRWAKNQIFKMAYSGRSERSVLKKESDWILKRGEAFIRGFSGGAPPETKAKLKKIYLLLNKLGSVRSAGARVHRLQQEIDKAAQSDKYKGLDLAHRARLLSEDTAKLHTDQAKWRTKLHTTVVEVRTSLMGLGVKVR